MALSLEREVPPTNAINDHDHGALVIVVAAFGLTCSLVFLLARLSTRWPWTSLFGIDDWAAVLATCVAIAQVGTVIGAVHAGFGTTGRADSSVQISEVKKSLYTSDLLYVVAEFSSRLVVGLLFLRLSSTPQQKKISKIIIGACVVCGITSVLAFAIQSNAYATKNVMHPASLFARWVAIEVMSMILDFSIIPFAVWLVYDLKMQWKSKLKVTSSFALRFPLIVLSILRLDNLRTSLWSHEFFFDYSTTEIYTQALMCYSLVSATVPCLRIFLGAFETGLLGGDFTHSSQSPMRTEGNATTTRSSYGGQQAARNNKSQVSHELREIGEEMPVGDAP